MMQTKVSAPQYLRGRPDWLKGQAGSILLVSKYRNQLPHLLLSPVAGAAWSPPNQNDPPIGYPKVVALLSIVLLTVWRYAQI